MDAELESRLQQVKEIARLRAEEGERALTEFLNGQPPSKACEKHQTVRNISRELTFEARTPYSETPYQSAVYEPCPECQAEVRERDRQEKFMAAGVPPLLIHATLDQLRYSTPNDQRSLEKCREWSLQPLGFLILLGNVGTGKSHIGAAILMRLGSGFFVSQSNLLRRLRATYRDRAADDIVTRAMHADLFVLDEVGVSAGGRDEAPMLYDILNHRYENFLPTILSSNLSEEDFKAALDDRIVDRIRQSNSAILRFCEKSKRAQNNKNYIEMAARMSGFKNATASEVEASLSTERALAA